MIVASSTSPTPLLTKEGKEARGRVTIMTPESRDAPDRHLCLVDGSGFLFRAFHALPVLTRPDGTPVNAVLGFTNMLLKLLDDLHASHVAVIFDSARESFRNEIFPEYKANRPDPPDELIPQFPLVRDAAPDPAQLRRERGPKTVCRD